MLLASTNASAKCGQAVITARIVSNGQLLPVAFNSLYYNVETCGLPPGDSILVTATFVNGLDCAGSPSCTIRRNGTTVFNTAGQISSSYYIPQPGTYYFNATWEDPNEA